MEQKKTVNYREFGALGDGKTNDMEAIIKTHEYANANGCMVVADHDAKYYIGDAERCAVIKTDTDFGNAEFIIDDTAAGVYEHRSVAIFEIRRDHPGVHYRAEDLAKVTDDTGIRAGDRRIPWLAGILEKKSMVILENAEHYDYVRFGCNRNAGSPRREVVIVDKDGTVDADVPVTFDYEKVTDLTVINVEDTPITVQGGKFRNICCRTVGDTEFQNRYKAYQRNICVFRSNVTLKDIDHGMLAEPLPTPRQSESYPYSGFLHIRSANNVKVIDCELTGHTTYYEDRSRIANDPCVPMGTYDLIVNSSTHISFENVTQKPETLLDGRYWGIMGSSYCKCFVFKNCRISRFDAHCGFWNTKLINCEISKALCVIGGGELYIENVKRTIGKDFIILRSDYGATFNGDITLKNCELCAIRNFDSTDPENNTLDETQKIPTAFVIAAQVRNGADRLDPTQDYYNWDFGYTCYMPQNVHIENLGSGADNTYIFTDVRDEHFCKADKRREYRRPRKVVVKGCGDGLKICPNEAGLCGILSAVPVEKG
ncbi:MAG: hypothetical protein IJX37_04510 [Oscillospiraceae bacterium]|nr:hypothetical protein [Oscillospiraceae bacterium]